MTPLLTVKNLSKSFGGLKAVAHVELRAFPNQILSIIGPNGAGKTTLFNCLTGIYMPDTGDVLLENKHTTGLPGHLICRKGMARTFQNIRLFPELSVLENVMVAQFHHYKISPLSLLLRSKAYCHNESQCREQAIHWLKFVGLPADTSTWARNLPYGLQRRLEIARALATQPKVLLLDEPGAGMNPSEIADIIQLIERIRQLGLAVILIEHHMQVVMKISQQIIVLDHGEIIAHGTPNEIQCNPKVIAAYLGETHHAET